MNKGKNRYDGIMCKKALIGMLIFIVVLFLLPEKVLAANVTTGKVGDNGGITWTYDADTYTLTLKGSDSGSWGVPGKSTYEVVSIFKGKAPYVRKIVVEDLTIVGSAAHFFAGLKELESIEFRKIDTSRVTDMTRMFRDCRSLKSLDLSGFDTSNVTNMSMLFYECKDLKEVNVSSFNTEQVTNMSYMFYECNSLEELDVTNFDCWLVTNMSFMFSGIAVRELDMDGFITSKVTNMMFMFSNCPNLTSLDLRYFRTGRVTRMDGMFKGCEKLEDLDLRSFETQNVEDMSLMFRYCRSLTELDLRNFNTSKVRYMESMFAQADNLTTLDISEFDMSNVSSVMYMCRSCRKLKKIYTPKTIPNNLEIKLADIYQNSQGVKFSKISAGTKNTTLTREPNPFSDVSEDSWQYEYVKFALNNNLIKGKATDEKALIVFDPDAPMTRAEFVQTLYNRVGKPAVTYTNKFSDVPEGKWYTNAILWAANTGLVAGKGNGYFDVSGEITREEVATILYKYAKYERYDTGGRDSIRGFIDQSSVSSWAVENMRWALHYGVIKGKGDRLAPLDNTTRAECATMLCNFMSYYEGY